MQEAFFYLLRSRVMSPIPERIQCQAWHFVLDLHGDLEPAQLRTRITDGLARLIACDRASFNEAVISADSATIVPSPAPAWWPRFGEVYVQHMRDHPSLQQDRIPDLFQVVALDDEPHASAWSKSTLRNEYFLPLDISHQLSARIEEHGQRRDIISLNRHGRGFSEQERALLGMLNPHIAQAWRNALVFDSLRRQLAQAEEQTSCATITADPVHGTARVLSRAASSLLRQYFGTDSAGSGRLPVELTGWLKAQDRRTTGPTLRTPLVVQRANGRLTIQLARWHPEEAILLLQATGPAHAASPRGFARLSPREREILAWLAEGKRNSEIAVIVSTSRRTVEKHVEHILTKLGVETRAAAIRLYCEHFAR